MKRKSIAVLLVLSFLAGFNFYWWKPVNKVTELAILGFPTWLWYFAAVALLWTFVLALFCKFNWK